MSSVVGKKVNYALYFSSRNRMDDPAEVAERIKQQLGEGFKLQRIDTEIKDGPRITFFNESRATYVLIDSILCMSWVVFLDDGVEHAQYVRSMLQNVAKTEGLPKKYKTLTANASAIYLPDGAIDEKSSKRLVYGLFRHLTNRPTDENLKDYEFSLRRETSLGIHSVDISLVKNKKAKLHGLQIASYVYIDKHKAIPIEGIARPLGEINVVEDLEHECQNIDNIQ